MEHLLSDELTARMMGAFAVTFSGESMYISSPAGLLPKLVTWTRAPRTVAKRQNPEKRRENENRTMIADIAVEADCVMNRALVLDTSATLLAQVYINIPTLHPGSSIQDQ